VGHGGDGDVTVVDGYTHFPAESVNRRFLRPSDTRSRCYWKGVASYYDVVVNGETNRDAAWYYPDPSPRAAPLVKGRIAFWRGVRVEGEGAACRGLLGRLGLH
jgi:uncharacterized protein (DUF427 family)